jgi:hypothetical protein
VKHHTIKQARLDPTSIFPRVIIEVFFDGLADRSSRVDLTEIFAQGGVFKTVQNPADIEVTPDGDTLFWRTGPGEADIVDLCSDALWLLAHPEDRAAAVSPAPRHMSDNDRPVLALERDIREFELANSKDLDQRVAALEQSVQELRAKVFGVEPARRPAR